MIDLGCDVAIIGAGTAGLGAERAARKTGAKTLLIDDRFPGTTCASVGCMPSKLLIAAADAAYNARKASTFGNRNEYIRGRSRRHGSRAQGARRVCRRNAEVDREDTRWHLHPAKGSFFGQDYAHARRRPESLGQGDRNRHGLPPKRAEALRQARRNRTHERDDLRADSRFLVRSPSSAQARWASNSHRRMARLGVQITVFDQGEHVAALRDAEVAKNLRSVLGKEFPVHLGVKLDVEKDGQGVHFSWSGASSGAASFERVLVAAGRPPALHDLNMAATDLETNEHGVPKFDPSTLQCGDTPIFLAGDVDAQRPVLHEASSEGAIAGWNAASFPKVRKAKRAVPLSIMFTDPPLATVGANRPMRWSSAEPPMPIKVEPRWKPATPAGCGSMPDPDTGIITGRPSSGRGLTTSPTSSRGRSSGGKRRTRCCSCRSTIRRSRKGSSPRCAKSAKP